jgi:hypothetical protein
MKVINYYLLFNIIINLYIYIYIDIGKLVLEKQVANNELASISKNLSDMKKQLETATSDKASANFATQELSKQLDTIKTTMEAGKINYYGLIILIY